MQHFYPFPSIEQFRTVVKYVNDRCGYHGIPRPKLKFSGTVKLHGTNAAVVVENGRARAQSRSAIITTENDNAGFARFVTEHEGLFVSYARTLQVLGDTSPIAFYGEWCGQGIQKGVAINGMTKRFIIFAIKHPNVESGEDGRWERPASLASITNGSRGFFPADKVDFIHNYPTWEIEIDFENPGEAQNKLVELTTAVEAECPVGKAITGVTGVGEGIVWVCDSEHAVIKVSDLIFKVKGEKHSDTKTKTLAPVDVEKQAGIKELAEAVTTPHRMEKGIDQLRLDNPGKDVLDMAYTGAFLKWVSQDVLKEELDMIEASGFDTKDVTKAVQHIAKGWFKEQTLLK